MIRLNFDQIFPDASLPGIVVIEHDCGFIFQFLYGVFQIVHFGDIGDEEYRKAWLKNNNTNEKKERFGK